MLSILLVGCFLTVDEDTFPEQYAGLYCNRTRECSRGYFEHEYDGDSEECAEDVEDLVDEVDDCDFDDDEARDCLEELQEVTCGELYEGDADSCARVYNCGLDDWF